MLSARPFFTRAGVSTWYWWKAETTCVWSMRIMLVMVGDTLLSMDVIGSSLMWLRGRQATFAMVSSWLSASCSAASLARSASSMSSAIARAVLSQDVFAIAA